MSYEAKTPNLELPQWVSSDKPEMTDFNSAFQKIDGGTVTSLNGVTGAMTIANSPTIHMRTSGQTIYADVYYPTVVEITLNGTSAEYFNKCYAMVFAPYYEDYPDNCLLFTPSWCHSAPDPGPITLTNIKFIKGTGGSKQYFPCYAFPSSGFAQRGYMTIDSDTNTITYTDMGGSGFTRCIPSYPVWCSYTGTV